MGLGFLSPTTKDLPPSLTFSASSLKMGDMRRKAVLAKTLLFLVVAALMLPAAICVVVALAALLSAIGDAGGGAALRYVALAGGVLWTADLIAIVLVQAIDSLDRPDDEDRE